MAGWEPLGTLSGRLLCEIIRTGGLGAPAASLFHFVSGPSTDVIRRRM